MTTEQTSTPEDKPAFYGFMDEANCRVDLCFTPSAPNAEGVLATPYYTRPAPKHIPIPDEAVITVWYDEEDNECKSDYVKVELDLFWDNFSHTRLFGDAYHDNGFLKAKEWATAYKLLKPEFKITEVHRPEVADPNVEVAPDPSE